MLTHYEYTKVEFNPYTHEPLVEVIHVIGGRELVTEDSIEVL